MAITYFQRSTTSDLTGPTGTGGTTRDLVASQTAGGGSADLISGNMNSGVFCNQNFFTPSGDPAANGTSTGSFTVVVRVSVQNANIGIRVFLRRATGGDTGGTEVEASEGSQTAGAASRTFTWTNPGLGTWAAGNRLRIRVQLTNTSGSMSQSATIAVDTSADTIATPFTVADQNFTRTVDDTLGLTDDGQSVSHAGTLTDTLGLTDSVSVDLTSGGEITRTVNDTLGFTDAVALDRGVSITDALGLSDGGFATEVGEDITDTLGLTDDVSVDFAGATTRTIDDTLGLTDSLTVESTFARTVDDALGLIDAVAVDFAGAATRTVTDALGLTDSVAVEATFARLISDTLGLTDAVSTVGGTVDLEYLAITVGPLREPLTVAAMAEPLAVAEIDPSEPVTVGAIRDTAPAIGTLRDTGPITDALQEPVIVEPMREPITVDQLRE